MTEANQQSNEALHNGPSSIKSEPLLSASSVELVAGGSVSNARTLFLSDVERVVQCTCGGYFRGRDGHKSHRRQFIRNHGEQRKEDHTSVSYAYICGRDGCPEQWFVERSWETYRDKHGSHGHQARVPYYTDMIKLLCAEFVRLNGTLGCTGDSSNVPVNSVGGTSVLKPFEPILQCHCGRLFFGWVAMGSHVRYLAGAGHEDRRLLYLCGRASCPAQWEPQTTLQMYTALHGKHEHMPRGQEFQDTARRVIKEFTDELDRQEGAAALSNGAKPKHLNEENGDLSIPEEAVDEAPRRESRYPARFRRSRPAKLREQDDDAGSENKNIVAAKPPPKRVQPVHTLQEGSSRKRQSSSVLDEGEKEEPIEQFKEDSPSASPMVIVRQWSMAGRNEPPHKRGRTAAVDNKTKSKAPSNIKGSSTAISGNHQKQKSVPSGRISEERSVCKQKARSVPTDQEQSTHGEKAPISTFLKRRGRPPKAPSTTQVQLRGKKPGGSSAILRGKLLKHAKKGGANKSSIHRGKLPATRNKRGTPLAQSEDVAKQSSGSHRGRLSTNRSQTSAVCPKTFPPDDSACEHAQSFDQSEEEADQNSDIICENPSKGAFQTQEEGNLQDSTFHGGRLSTNQRCDYDLESRFNYQEGFTSRSSAIRNGRLSTNEYNQTTPVSRCSAGNNGRFSANGRNDYDDQQEDAAVRRGRPMDRDIAVHRHAEVPVCRRRESGTRSSVHEVAREDEHLQYRQDERASISSTREQNNNSINSTIYLEVHAGTGRVVDVGVEGGRQLVPGGQAMLVRTRIRLAVDPGTGVVTGIDLLPRNQDRFSSSLNPRPSPMFMLDGQDWLGQSAGQTPVMGAGGVFIDLS